MEDLAVFTALNHSGSFGKNFVKFKNNKYVIYRLRVGPYGEKLWPRSCLTRAYLFQIALEMMWLRIFISTTSSVVFITARITNIRFFYHNAYIWFKFIYNHMRQCWHSIGLSLTFSFIWRTLIITRKNITRVCCIWSVLAFYLLEVFNMLLLPMISILYPTNRKWEY